MGNTISIYNLAYDVRGYDYYVKVSFTDEKVAKDHLAKLQAEGDTSLELEEVIAYTRPLRSRVKYSKFCLVSKLGNRMNERDNEIIEHENDWSSEEAPDIEYANSKEYKESYIYGHHIDIRVFGYNKEAVEAEFEKRVKRATTKLLNIYGKDTKPKKIVAAWNEKI
jgi:hypothetical protein